MDIPLDPDEGDQYVKLVREDLDYVNLDNFYKVIAWREDYINTIVDDKLSWTSINSCSSNFDKVLENWQDRLYEVSTRKCA